MAGAGLDEGVGNLQRFIAGLQKTIAELGEAVSSLETAGGEFSRLEGEAEDAVGGLAEDLEEGRDRLEQASEDARDAVGELTEAAEDVAEARLADAEESLDEAGQECEAQLAEGRSETEATFARLSEAGFQGYGSALDEAESELQALDAADREAFDGLEEGTGRMRDRLDDKRAETSDAFEEAASQVGDASSELEDAFKAVTEEWREVIDGELREGCESAGDELARIYEQWKEGAASAADALEEQVASLVEQAEKFARSECAQALTGAVEQALNDAGAEVIERFEDTDKTLGTGEGLAESLEGMTPDLQKSLSVIDEVDRLLNAME